MRLTGRPSESDLRVPVVFSGQEAWTANENKLAQAQEMEGSQNTPLEIWERTGWFRGRDGHWRFEISDERASVNWGSLESPLPSNPRITTLGDVLTHYDLYSAYPQLADRVVTFVRMPRSGREDHGGVVAAYYPDTGNFEVNLNARFFNEQLPSDPGLRSRNLETRLRGALLHEIQHAIQDMEGFFTGPTAPGSGMPHARDIPYTAHPWEKEAEEIERRVIQRRTGAPDDVVRNTPWSPTVIPTIPGVTLQE